MLLQAVWNYESLQGLGFGWSLLPALERIYPDPRERARRLHVHLGVFNSNPYLATLGMGVAIRVEEEIARGRGAEEGLARLLKALRGTLGALGDELFWVALRPALGLSAALVALIAPSPWPAAAFLVVFNAVAQGVRWGGVRVGFTSGAGIARVLQSPAWHRAGVAARTLGAFAAGAALGTGAVMAFSSHGGLPGAGIFSGLVALLWLAGLRFGSRRRLLSPALAFLALVILLSAIFHLRPGALPW